MATMLFGQRIKRREDPRLISGKGRYVADLQLPGARGEAGCPPGDPRHGIRVEGEPLPAVVEAAKALDSATPVIHEGIGSNLAARWSVKTAGVEAAPGEAGRGL